MTPEEMRIAIAESLGNYRKEQGALKVLAWWNKDGKYLGIEWLPEYDLNEMHEVEEHLIGEELRIYEQQLVEVLIRDPVNGRQLWHTNAQHRAEAYLRTKGLWKE